MVLITHEQNIICSKTHIDRTTHEQNIICTQLFAGHVVGSQPMKRKEKMHQMIIIIIIIIINKALMTNVKAQLMERDAVYAQSLDYYC